MKIIGTILVFFMALEFSLPHVSAQSLNENTIVKCDTNYIEAYKDELTSRIYLSRKQNSITLTDRLLNPWLRYKTNDNLLLGLGCTYSFLTVNLAVKMPLFNNDDHIYGESKYVDLQTHTIFRSFILDLYLQWNRGFYMSNPQNVLPDWEPDQNLPFRGDLRSSIIGLNIQYLFNSSRYSYKASFLQNEFQKRSAGSPIGGIEGYWMLAMTDSALIPEQALGRPFLENHPFNQSDISNIGMNGGYAYTFVWNETLYLSLSSVFGISAGYNWIHHTATSNTRYSGMTFGINNSSRISLGYNSARYYVGLSYLHFSMSNRVGGQGDWIAYSTGNFRFSVVRRFRLKRPIRMLRPDLWSF